jgi:hypothetical protein
MPESDQPLLESARVTTNSTTYVDLIKYKVDPNKMVFVRDVTVELNSTSGSPTVSLSINGETKLRDFQPVDTDLKMAFGGHLAFRGTLRDPAIWIRVKNDGTTNTTFTVVITGVTVDFTPVKRPP